MVEKAIGRRVRQKDSLSSEAGASASPDVTDRTIAYCKIFPPIGVARLGNSPEEYFLGPDAPGVVPNEGGTYKDAQGRVKRQAAHFRIYAFNAADELIAELDTDTPNVGSISWTVTLANAKAEWWGFNGAANVATILGGGEGNPPKRNAEVPEDDRHRLVIGPATDTLAGPHRTSGPLVGHFLDKQESIYLGELRTDAQGRLLVLGGRGEADTVFPDNPLSHYANNDGWYDDTSDGPVTATVSLRDGAVVPVRGRAWVIVAPPHFSPHTQNVVTVLEVMTEAAVEHRLAWPSEFGPPPSHADPVSFTHDIYPILRRLSMYQWVSDRARRGHTAGKRGDLLDPKTLRLLADPAAARQPFSPQRRVFDRVRKPLIHPPALGTRPPSDDELHPESQEALNQANLSFMPPLAGDEGDVTHPIYGDKDLNAQAPQTWLSVTATQYRKLSRWKDGDFTADWTGEPAAVELDAMPVAARPGALTKASLDACQGGAFYPGIEITSIIRFASFYSEAFRVSDDYAAGDITRWMALPWQGDFYECQEHWWPTVRPDDVVPAHEYEHLVTTFSKEVEGQRLSSLLVARQPWARGLGLTIPPRPGLPDAGAAHTAAEYQRLCTRQLRRFAGSFLGLLPAPISGEIPEFYVRRLQTFLDRTIMASGGFPLPPVQADLSAYFQEIFSQLQAFLRSEIAIPGPEPQEDLKAYVARLADVAAGQQVWQGLFDVQWPQRNRHQGKNDLVRDWSRLGFVVPKQTPSGEIVYVESDRKRYDLLSFRDYFYYLVNMEDYPDFIPKARELAEEYLKLAWDMEPSFHADPNLEEYGFFPYDEVTFRARLEKIYENQRRAGEAYNPVTGDGEPLFRTGLQIVERIRQLAPFNQLDGSWLEKIAHAGPSDEIQGFLFEIWSDEVGNGDPAQSHANVYSDLLHSAGIYLPPLRSRAYADNPDLWESSFGSPAYQTAIAQFPDTYFPELLGMTLYLEWEAVYLPSMVKLYNYHGYNSLFYRLHVAIDNPVNGHGGKARDAVVHYLDHVRTESGDKEMQEHWRRIWNGYLAFKFVGGGDWQYYFTNPANLEERVMAIIMQKRHYAQLNHGVRRLGPNSINDWFDEVPDFLNQLIHSDLINPGDARSSRLFDVLSFTGPMLKVFNAQEKQVLADWINSLPPAPLGGALQPAEAMCVLIGKFAARGMGVPDHAQFTLTGDYVDRADPARTQRVTKPVSWWFQLNDPPRFLAALADPANGWVVAGNVDESRLVRELLSESRPMARFLIQTVPEVGNKSARQIIVEWIAAGCPLPQVAPSRRMESVPVRSNVRMDAPHLAAQQVEPHARLIQARVNADAPDRVRMSPAQRRGLRQRFYGPGGGAAH